MGWGELIEPSAPEVALGYNDGAEGEEDSVPDTLCYVCPRCGERWQATSEDDFHDVCPDCGEIGIEED